MSEELALPVFAPHERVCGNCKLWRAHSVDAVKGWIGQCRVQESRGMFPPSAPTCDAFAPRGEVTALPTVEEPKARRLKPIGPEVRRAGVAPAVVTEVARSTRGGEAVDLQLGGSGDETGGTPGVLAAKHGMTRNELMDLFLEASGLAEVTLAPKWEGGVMQIMPKDQAAQSKDVPVDDLCRKVVSIRDKLRVLEQKVNAHGGLTHVQKVELEQLITRAYAALGGFNVLFRDVDPVAREDVRAIFHEALGAHDVDLAPKWEGGHVQVVPKEGGQAREWPIGALVTRVVVVRDRLRLLEKRITAHPKLGDEEKRELAGYVTRCNGSLTTFNALFRDKADQFVGQKGDE